MGRNYNAEFDENELMDELNELDEEIVADQLNGGAVSNPSYIPQQANSNPAQPIAGGANQTEADALQNMMNI